MASAELRSEGLCMEVSTAYISSTGDMWEELLSVSKKVNALCPPSALSPELPSPAAPKKTVIHIPTSLQGLIDPFVLYKCSEKPT